MLSTRPVVIGIGGFASNIGKTTLVCELLQAFPGWEAIKTTRGHYRSCGKDPQACCVSHLLSDHPIVRSGREETYAPGKDTGRYWDAGAANVHWVVATEEQVEKGIEEALSRVGSNGVFIEGNSFSEYVAVDLMVMVVRAEGVKIKKSARRALAKSSSLYFSDEVSPDRQQRFNRWLRSSGINSYSRDFAIHARQDLPQLIARVRRVLSHAAA